MGSKPSPGVEFIRQIPCYVSRGRTHPVHMPVLICGSADPKAAVVQRLQKGTRARSKAAVKPEWPDSPALVRAQLGKHLATLIRADALDADISQKLAILRSDLRSCRKSRQKLGNQRKKMLARIAEIG